MGSVQEMKTVKSSLVVLHFCLGHIEKKRLIFKKWKSKHYWKNNVTKQIFFFNFWNTKNACLETIPNKVPSGCCDATFFFPLGASFLKKIES